DEAKKSGDTAESSLYSRKSSPYSFGSSGRRWGGSSAYNRFSSWLDDEDDEDYGKKSPKKGPMPKFMNFDDDDMRELKNFGFDDKFWNEYKSKLAAKKAKGGTVDYDDEEFYAYYEMAIVAATAALEKNPFNVKALVARAKAYYGLRRYPQAIGDCLKAAELEPKNSKAYSILAWSYYQTQEYEKGFSAAKNAVDNDPESTDALLIRSLCAEKLGDYYQMLSDLQRLSELDKENYEKLFLDAIKKYGDKAPDFLPYGEGKLSKLKRWRAQFLPKTKFLSLLGAAIALGALLGFAIIKLSKAKETMAEAESASAEVSAPAHGIDADFAKIAPMVEVPDKLLADKYKFTKPLGGGNTGMVYEGVNPALNLKVAIKQINFETPLGKDDELIKALEKTAGVRHINLAEIFHISAEDKALYIASELIDGPSLGTKLADGVLTFYEARSVFNDVCDGLSCLHANAMPHGRLHPSDIVTGSNGITKIINSNLASVLHRASAAGPDPYLAPEADKDVNSPAGDIYSMAVCLYKTLTGQLPFNPDGTLNL
ncbi:MAG: protein kinase, partial [Elusimicrobia bacterium]|nr:protein kinase [Elusimicrobiota bacterium]